MPTLKFKIKDFEFEYIGEHGDMVKFIQTLMAGSFNITSLEKTSHRATSIRSQEQPIITPKNMSLPPFDDVLSFIISRHNYLHTLYDVQKNFFGRTFTTTDKGAIGMYLKTMNQLKEVRAEIEKRYGGKFEKKRGKGRLDYYTFKQEQKPLI